MLDFEVVAAVLRKGGPMDRLVVACSVFALLAGGCASSLSSSGVVATSDAVGLPGEQPLTRVIAAPGRPPATAPHGPSALRLVSDTGMLEEPPAGPPAAESEVNPDDIEVVPADAFVPKPRDVVQPPCAAPRRLARSCCWNRCEKAYVGIAPTLMPGIGGGFEFGVHFNRSRNILWSFELGMQYQDLWKEFSDEPGDGAYSMARVGIRARFSPQSCGHLTLRFGGTWFEAEGTPIELSVAQIEKRGDYLGAYVGIGYEWDIGRRWSTGPEIALIVAGAINARPDRLDTGRPVEGREDLAIVPVFYWHVNYRL